MQECWSAGMLVCVTRFYLLAYGAVGRLGVGGSGNGSVKSARGRAGPDIAFPPTGMPAQAARIILPHGSE